MWSEQTTAVSTMAALITAVNVHAERSWRTNVETTEAYSTFSVRTIGWALGQARSAAIQRDFCNRMPLPHQALRTLLDRVGLRDNLFRR
jgi:hypothetical protein